MPWNTHHGRYDYENELHFMTFFLVFYHDEFA